MAKYVGVDGVARRVNSLKMYTGIANVARAVSAAYVGVAGVARKYLGTTTTTTSTPKTYSGSWRESNYSNPGYYSTSNPFDRFEVPKYNGSTLTGFSVSPASSMTLHSYRLERGTNNDWINVYVSRVKSSAKFRYDYTLSYTETTTTTTEI